MNRITVVLITLLYAQLIYTQDDLGTIIFSSVLFRHGDRSPISTYPNDPYNQSEIWPEGPGQLTPIGREQHFELGTYLRSRYAQLLPKLYNAGDLFVRSSDVDRTLMSAECNLFALYPHTTKYITKNVLFQPIPIHTTSSSNDKIFDTPSLCPKFKKTYKLMKKSPSYQCIMNLTEGVRSAVSRKAGLHYYEAHIYDTLFIEELYNLTLPEWTKDYYPEPMKSLHLLEDFLSEGGTKELRRLYSGTLLNEMITNMQKKSQGTLNPDRKLFIYSGHDTTVSNLLMNLGVFNEILPPYASCVLVELRKKNKDYFVTISYRNTTAHEPYLLTLPNCDGLCPLESFVNLTKSSIPTDWDAECHQNPGPEVNFAVPTFGLPADWLQCFPRGISQDGKYVYVSLREVIEMDISSEFLRAINVEAN